MNRRRLLEVMLHVGGAAVAAVVAIPALVTMLSPALGRTRGERWQGVGSLADFPIGETRLATVDIPRDDGARSLRQRGVYVWRPAEDEIVVFSRNCTDLSCPVVYDAGSTWFYCPCHGGIFAQDGTPMAGPPPRPLYRYANRVEQGQLQIDLNSVPPMA